jgi:hypothetical protein
VLCGLLLWFGVGSFGGTQQNVVSQPSAARQALAESAGPLPGLSSDTLGEPTLDTRSRRRAERLERRSARTEAARAKREAMREARSSKAQERREARASKAQERREAREAKREAAREARASSVDQRDARASSAQERREAREAKREAAREARDAKREAARERYAARVEARRQAAEDRRQAKLERREQARARRESASETREPVTTESASLGSSGLDLGLGNTGTLQVNSLPWAQVYVDGRMIGYTPQRGIALAPGDHEVRLVNPAFRMKKTLRVQIAQGERVSRREILEE